MRRALPLLILGLLLPGQVAEPALRPGEAVVDAGQAGVIRGEAWDPVAEQPAAGLLVSLFRPGRESARVYPEPWVREPGEADEAVARLRTDHDGRFFFRGLAPGYYVVRPRGVLQSGGGAEVHLTQEASEQEVRLQVVLGAAIRGVVLDPSGQPLTDFTVHVVGLDRGDGLNAAHDHQAALHVRTDAQGRFTLAPLPTGTVWIQAAARSFGYSTPIPHEVRSGDLVEGVDIVVPDEREMLGQRSPGDGGVGVRLDFGRSGPRIRQVIDGMPAQAAGLEGGDLVVEVAGLPTRFMPPAEFTDRCRGPVGTEVSLKVRRSDGSVEELVLVRQAFPD